LGKKFLKRGIFVGIVFLFTGTNIISITMGTTLENRNGMSIDEKENPSPLENVTVTFIFPENGIYWDTHKIAPFSNPVILHGNGIVYGHDVIFTLVKFKIEPVEGIDSIDFYFNGVLVYTWSGPGPTSNATSIPMTRFSQASLKIVAHTAQGSQGSNEITIWRLFL